MFDDWLLCKNDIVWILLIFKINKKHNTLMFSFSFYEVSEKLKSVVIFIRIVCHLILIIIILNSETKMP